MDIPAPASPSLRFWHGAQRWDGRPELRPSRAKCYECGPGFYLTTHLSTARKYAKGGGQTVLVELDPNVRLLEDSTLSLEDLLEGLAALPRARNRKAIEQGLRESAQRHPDGRLPADYLMNYCVNHEALGGESGPTLARWYASKGIDASLCLRSNGENWVVVFNPDKVYRAQVLRGDAPWALGNFPSLREQQLACAPPAAPARGPRLR